MQDQTACWSHSNRVVSIVKLLVYEEQQNVAAVEEKMLDEDVEKIVKGEDDLDGNDFADTVLLTDEDSGDRVEPESHKENPKKNDDDDDDDD
ncbi:hypothetical protein Tco_1576418 [Tanacetum coccineum]